MVFIDGIIYSLQDHGGISVYFSEVLKRLSRDNKDYSLLLYKNSSKALKEYNIEGALENTSFMYRFFDVDIGKTGVFHSSYYRLPKNRENVKIVTTVHDFTHERYIGGLKGWVHHWQKKRAILASDVVICISHSTKRDLIRFIPEAKGKDIRIIYNGVSDRFFQICKDDCHEPYILYVGARSGYKNFTLLCESMAMLPKYHLVIVGGGDLTSIEKRSLDKFAGGRYEYRSFVGNQELNALYNSAFCFVYPSLYEGFGIPVLEAMRAGCPVIATNTSSIPEVGGEAVLYIDGSSKGQIAQNVKILENPLIRSKFVLKGKLQSEKFTWEQAYEELQQVYEFLS